VQRLCREVAAPLPCYAPTRGTVRCACPSEAPHVARARGGPQRLDVGEGVVPEHVRRLAVSDRRAVALVHAVAPRFVAVVFRPAPEMGQAQSQQRDLMPPLRAGIVFVDGVQQTREGRKTPTARVHPPAPLTGATRQR
jgi:hypothetical protein